MPINKPKIVLFDIEATNLSADFGRMLSFGWKELGEKKAHVKNITDFTNDPTDDKELALFARGILSEADIIVGWYSVRFDFPYIQSRLLSYKQDPIPPVAHIDGWRIARDCLRLHSNRLASVSNFLEVEGKTPLKPTTWAKATAGCRKSIKYVGEHCRQDVEVLEQVYLRIRPFIRNHPSLRVLVRDACPICGAHGMLVEKGTRLTRAGTQARYKCNRCKGWSQGPVKKVYETNRIK